MAHHEHSMLRAAYAHERQLANHVVLTQPVGDGRVENFTWSQVMDQARRFASFLKAQHFPPSSTIAVLTKNTAHYFMVELGIWMAGHTTVSIFPTDSASTIAYILKHSEARLLVIGKLDNWAAQSIAVPSGMPCVELPLGPGTDAIQWADLMAAHEPFPEEVERQPHALSMIIYTSGSTGDPKGVMHNFETTHRATKLIVDWRHGLLGEAPLRVLSHLPYAHVMERLTVFCATVLDGKNQVFFSESLATFVDDIKRARPTLFATVPRLWMKFQLGVFSKMPAAQLDAMLDNPDMAPVVGKQVLAGLGLDAAVYGASGAAPLPVEVIDWYRKLGLPMYEAYGMTENFAMASIGNKDFHAVGCVGVPYPGVDIKISEDGEVLVKSSGQMVGYFKQPELTAACLTSDGYFKTGDLGELTATGELKITGRVKDLFKTSKGKYIAPAPIESVFNASALVEMSAVSGANFEAPFVAVVLAEHLRPTWADDAKRTELIAQLLTLLDSVNAQLPAFQQLKFLVVCTDPWSIENACLTPTLKLKRANIDKRLLAHAADWYQRGERLLVF